MDIRARAKHATLVPRPFHLHDLQSCHPFHLCAGPNCHAVGGMFASSNVHPHPTHVAHNSFVLPAGSLHSVLNIDQLQLGRETYKLYKGMRGRTLGHVE